MAGHEIFMAMGANFIGFNMVNTLLQTGKGNLSMMHINI
jgi:hypothetical protein